MSEVKNLEQLKSKSPAEILSYKKDALARKAELDAAKAKGGNAWTTDMQEELEEIVMFLADVDDIVDEKLAERAKAYVPSKGSEDMVHLSVVKGKRFNSRTGKEISKPYTLILTYSEWQLFKNNFKGLGYLILSVLHDPYGEAKNYVFKEEENE